MAGQHLEQTLHLDDHSIVEYIVATVHFLGRCILVSTSGEFLHLLAALVLGFTVLLQDGIDSLFDRLLVPLLPDSHNQANDDVLQAVLKQISLGTIGFDLIIRDDLSFHLLGVPSDHLLSHFKTLLSSELLFVMIKSLDDLVLVARKHLLASVLDELICDFLGQHHDIIKRDGL